VVRVPLNDVTFRPQTKINLDKEVLDKVLDKVLNKVLDKVLVFLLPIIFPIVVPDLKVWFASQSGKELESEDVERRTRWGIEVA